MYKSEDIFEVCSFLDSVSACFTRKFSVDNTLNSEKFRFFISRIYGYT